MNRFDLETTTPPKPSLPPINLGLGSSNTSTANTTPVSVAKQPFAASAPGIALNTILGIPAATKDVAISIARAVPRGILSIAQTVAPESVRNNIGQINPSEDFGKTGSVLLGSEPIQSLQTKAAGTSHFLQQYGVDPKTSDRFGTLLSVGGTLLDVYPGGSEERKGIEEAARLSTEELAKYFAKTTDEKSIAGVLKILGHPEENLLDTAKRLSETKTVEDVKLALNQDPAHLKFDANGRPLAYTARERNILSGGAGANSSDTAISRELNRMRVRSLSGIERQLDATGIAKVAEHPDGMKLILQNDGDGLKLSLKNSKIGSSELSLPEKTFKNTESALAYLRSKGVQSTIKNVSPNGPRALVDLGLDPKQIISVQRFPEAKAKIKLGEFDHFVIVRDGSLDFKNKNGVAFPIQKRIGKENYYIMPQKDAQQLLDNLFQNTEGKAGRTYMGQVMTSTKDFKEQMAGLLNTEKLSTEGSLPQTKLGESPREIVPQQTTLLDEPPFRSMGDLIRERGAASIEPGEATTLEKSAQATLERSASGDISREMKDSSSLKKIIENYQTPVKKKVNILDYVRTPDRVLKKIGLGDEAAFLRRQYEGFTKELPLNIQKITDWSKELPASSNERIFDFLDGKTKTPEGLPLELTPKEKKVAGEVRGWLEDWANRLDLPQEKRIANYITHLFDDELIKKEFDEDLAKIIAEKVPGEVYDPFLQKRLGQLGYKRDTWKALDAYAKRATRKVYMDPALEKIADKASGFEESQWKYVKRYMDGVNMRPTELENLIDNGIKSVFGYKAGQRPFTRISQKVRQWVNRGSLGLNIGATLRNLTQGVNTYAELGEKYTALGYLGLMRNGTKELNEVGVLADSFIQDRTVSAIGRGLQKLDKGLFTPFETAEKINRGAAYYGAKSRALAQGKTLQEAVEAGKELVRKTQFSFGRIDTPLVLQSDLMKSLLQFQSFTLKQGEYLSEKAARKEWAGLTRYVLGSVAMLGTVGKLFGMKWQDIIPSLRISTPPTLTVPTHLALDATGKAQDSYGNKLSVKQMVAQLGNDLIPYIPGGSQAKKTIQGLAAVSRGKDVTAAGKTKYNIKKTLGNYVRAAAFGKYNLPAAQKYYSKVGSPKKKAATNRF